jgi:RNA recognition motif-containing protein
MPPDTDRSLPHEKEAAVTDETVFKIHIARVPTKFTDDIVRRILEDSLREDSDDPVVQTVELIYPRDNGEHDRKASDDNEKNSTKDDNNKASKEHRGFGFVSFTSQQAMEAALKLGTVKGGRKRTSTKLYTMHLRAYEDKLAIENCGENASQNTSLHDVCYLWSLHRCPYGDECKFRHVGPGGCVNDHTDVNSREQHRKKKGKCFAFKKGKCDKGDDCPFSHDFVLSTVDKKDTESKSASKFEKDCINWKTKGKCRKGDKCEYRHEPELQQRALEKKKRKRQDDDNEHDKKQKKEKQPLAVRVFGMPYACTEDDVRDLFKECGVIHKIAFPTFEDSGRSKGFCGVWFVSPKAAEKALELDGTQMHDRWIRIQRGKTMDVKEWEKLHYHPATPVH